MTLVLLPWLIVGNRSRALLSAYAQRRQTVQGITHKRTALFDLTLGAVCTAVSATALGDRIGRWADWMERVRTAGGQARRTTARHEKDEDAAERESLDSR